MARTVLFTGFPGFIGTRLVRRLLDDEATRVVAVVERSFLDKARRVAEGLGDGRRDRVDVVEGDIARPGLGLSVEALALVRGEARRCFHLAALYNLAAPRDVSYRINVLGTEHVLDLCETVPGFEGLDYFSTCYVAGDRRGVVLERELEAGQRFKNFYEETKFLAEAVVRGRAGRVPAAIFRPGIVVGDSRTGEIEKYDGPYYHLRAFMELERRGRLDWRASVLLAPTGPGRIALVPVDYIVEATLAISSRKDSIGRTFALVPEEQPRGVDVGRAFAERLGVKEPPLRVPAHLLRRTMDLSGIEIGGIPRQVLDYMSVDVRFDDRNAREMLQGTGIACPPFESYVDRMVEFVRAHPEIKPVR